MGITKRFASEDYVTEQITVIDEKVTTLETITEESASDLVSHTSNTSNPHSVTASQIGLTFETWTFTLEDGSTVTKEMAVK